MCQMAGVRNPIQEVRGDERRALYKNRKIISPHPYLWVGIELLQNHWFGCCNVISQVKTKMKGLTNLLLIVSCLIENLSLTSYMHLGCI